MGSNINMPFPAAIQAELSALNAAYTAASPLSAASDSTVYALAVQAVQFVDDVDAALDASAGDLDAFPNVVMPMDIAAGVLALVDASGTQTALSDLSGFAGRIASNLTNG